MSTNCIRCGSGERDGIDLLCSACRNDPKSELENIRHDYIELTGMTSGGGNYQRQCEHMALTAIPRLIEMVEDARRDQMERDCRAACIGCEQGWLLIGEWQHDGPYGFQQCESWRIRKAFEEGANDSRL